MALLSLSQVSTFNLRRLTPSSLLKENVEETRALAKGVLTPAAPERPIRLGLLYVSPLTVGPVPLLADASYYLSVALEDAALT